MTTKAVGLMRKSWKSGLDLCSRTIRGMPKYEEPSGVGDAGGSDLERLGERSSWLEANALHNEQTWAIAYRSSTKQRHLRSERLEVPYVSTVIRNT
jgi:hypothetical protein